ncbi:hypothetical protein [Flavobacterium sp.]|jgi:hypothetical protein|uniref:hypothetical protein n=1 Tax=Flavobacterium sp. TaxID=239 RepID=UPI0037BE43B1
MISAKEIMDTRAMSGFPVSVGTGLGLEALFDPIDKVIDETRTVPPKANRSLYTDYLFNISTLLRNLLGSVQYKDLQQVSKQLIYDTLLSEIDFISNFCLTQGINAKFYVHTYDYPRKTYPDKLRLASSDQQKYLHEVSEYCLGKIRKQDDVLHFVKDVHLRGSPELSALILTHVAWDLLSYGRFRRLDLLESHTGVIKTRKEWNTKYFKVPDKDMSSLPFMEYLLTTFGDHVMFKPAPLKDRVELYDSLIKKKVHPLMTETTFSFLR